MGISDACCSYDLIYIFFVLLTWAYKRLIFLGGALSHFLSLKADSLIEIIGNFRVIFG